VSDFVERCRAEVIKTARAMGYQGERLMTRLNDLGFSPAEAATMMQAEEKAAHGAQIRAAATAAARDAVAEAVDRLRAAKRASTAKRTSGPPRLEEFGSWERWRDAMRKRPAASGEKIEKIQKTEEAEGKMRRNRVRCSSRRAETRPTVGCQRVPVRSGPTSFLGS